MREPDVPLESLVGRLITRCTRSPEDDQDVLLTLDDGRRVLIRADIMQRVYMEAVPVVVKDQNEEV